VDAASKASHHSASARLFYRFVPADADAKDKPVLVLFNGGPGATSMLIMAFGTGPTTLDVHQPAAAAQPNPNSLSQLANLLYIDARNTGFSYQVDEPGYPRDVALGADSLNAFVDAADFVRVILRVLAAQPALRNNPVALVGESYGGERAGLVLSLLFDGQWTKTLGHELGEEIDSHFAAVFPTLSPEQRSAEVRALQFGWQILIQPLVAGLWFQKQGPAVACKGDTRLTAAECAKPFEMLYQQLGTQDGFTALMGRAPDRVPELRADERGAAFRCLGDCDVGLLCGCSPPPESKGLEATLGGLAAGDRYFMESARYAGADWTQGFSAFDQDRCVDSFLLAARYARTLITDAAYDAILPAANIVPAFQSVASDSAHGLAGASAGQEQFVLQYRATDAWDAGSRVVLNPRFSASGHSVPLDEPARFFEVVRGFLAP
jgi:pimeloyl-ACP methyl ester carboxylesterase